jgi:hypothetical protein
MNLGTMTQAIVEDIHSLAPQSVVWRKIIESIRFHREKRYWFNERNFNFSYVIGVRGYKPGDGNGLPDDLVEIVGNFIYVRAGGVTGSYRNVVQRITSEEMEHRIAYNPGKAIPQVWDFWNMTLRFDPPPPNSTDMVQGRYVTDIGLPRASYSGAAWVFTTPNGDKPLTGDFTSDWFDEKGAFNMVKMYATYLIYANYLRDADAATEALSRWLEETGSIAEENEGKTGPLLITPTLLD